MTRAVRNSPWNPDQTEDFRRICIKNQKGWKAISLEFSEFSGRTYTGNQCMNRWNQINPEAKKGPWIDEEDEILRAGVARFGNEDVKWGNIAKSIPGRNAKQCRERWKTALDPSIDRSEFKQYEDRLILEERLNKKGWSAIANQLPGRVDNTIKNRWNTIILPVIRKLHPENLEEYVLDEIPRIVERLRCSKTPETSNRKSRALRDVTNQPNVENETPLKRHCSTMDTCYHSPQPTRRQRREETPQPFGDGYPDFTEHQLDTSTPSNQQTFTNESPLSPLLTSTSLQLFLAEFPSPTNHFR